MKKVIFTLCAISISLFLIAQNVGVGTPTPTEKLDVNGNINVAGTIKANGVDGTAGQVLMKNSSGALVWENMCEFKNFEQYSIIGPGTWPVPSGVTKVMVELWGGGGGGNVHGGGGGGGYARALFNVTPLQSISYTIGNGGTGTLSVNASSGGSTTVTYGGVSVYAGGGGGASYNNANYGTPGAGGNGGVNVGGYTFFYMTGQAGSPINVSYYQYNATTFYQTGQGGKGGDAANTINTGGIGASYVGNTDAGTIVKNYYGGLAGSPGGGGSGSYNFGGNTTAGTNGSGGKIIIWY